MGKVKENLMTVHEICEKVYNKSGVGGVIDHILEQQSYGNPPYMNVRQRICKPCENVQPSLDGECLVCGSKTEPLGLAETIQTVGELRELMSDLDDHDLVVVEGCDEDGEAEDLYPMSLDIIDGLKLTDDTNVREVRFCQRPNGEPDTRDKQSIIDALINEIKSDAINGDETVLDELLNLIPYELLYNALPEKKYKSLYKPLNR